MPIVTFDLCVQLRGLREDVGNLESSRDDQSERAEELGRQLDEKEEEIKQLENAKNKHLAEVYEMK